MVTSRASSVDGGSTDEWQAVAQHVRQLGISPATVIWRLTTTWPQRDRAAFQIATWSGWIARAGPIMEWSIPAAPIDEADVGRRRVAVYGVAAHIARRAGLDLPLWSPHLRSTTPAEVDHPRIIRPSLETISGLRVSIMVEVAECFALCMARVSHSNVSPQWIRRWQADGTAIDVIEGATPDTSKDAIWTAHLGSRFLEDVLSGGRADGSGVEPSEQFIDNLERALRKVWRGKRHPPSESDVARAYGLSKSAFHDRLRDVQMRWAVVKGWRPDGPSLRAMFGLN